MSVLPDLTRKALRTHDKRAAAQTALTTVLGEQHPAWQIPYAQAVPQVGRRRGSSLTSPITCLPVEDLRLRPICVDYTGRTHFIRRDHKASEAFPVNQRVDILSTPDYRRKLRRRTNDPLLMAARPTPHLLLVSEGWTPAPGSAKTGSVVMGRIRYGA